jgi:cell division protein FtsN
MKYQRWDQRGGTVIGIIVGILLGLVAALAVAIYVTKVPVPFVNKPPVRSSQQDEEEARKNKGWDPNAPLQNKAPGGKPATAVVPAPAAPAAPAPASPPPAMKPGADPVAKPPATTAPAAAPAAVVKPDTKPYTKAADPADPLGELAKAKTAGSSGGTVDPFSYFVQAGAFRTPEDAEAQRAKLGLMGMDAKVTEREQAGRTVYRVRVGPFEKKDDADKTKERLDGSGFETAMVRVQR